MCIKEGIDILCKIRESGIHNYYVYCGLAIGSYRLELHDKEKEIIDLGVEKYDIDPYMYSEYLFVKKEKMRKGNTIC